MKYFAEEVQKREEIGASYIELLKEKGLSLPVVKKDRTSVFAQFTMRSEQRKEVIEKLNSVEYCNSNILSSTLTYAKML